MMSERNDGASIAEVTGRYLGPVMQNIMRLFSVVLLIMVGTVFAVGPAGLIVTLCKNLSLIHISISFVTNAAGSILQLAVSLDYSVFLIHRFAECRAENPDASPEECMVAVSYTHLGARRCWPAPLPTAANRPSGRSIWMRAAASWNS